MSSSEKFVQPSIPRFDGHYDYWSMTMENFLRSKEMWNLVSDGISAPATGSSAASEAQKRMVEEAKLKDLKVKNYLFQAIDREVLETILDKGTSKAIWDSMKQKFQGSTKVRRAQLQALRREFELLAMKEGEQVDTFFGRTLTVVNKMKSNGESMDQNTVESNDLNTLSLDELHGSLRVHEQRIQGYQEEEYALKVAQEERPNRGRGRSPFRGARGRGRGRQILHRATMECYKCHKLGHFQFDCPDWEKTANYAELEEEDDILLMSYIDSHQDSSPRQQRGYMVL